MSGFSRAAAWLIIRLRWLIVLAWLVATAAVVLYLPSLQEAGRETSLVGLVPKHAESIEAGIRSSKLFSVPVVTHTHVVQRNPEGLSEEALGRVARRAKLIADKQDPELVGGEVRPADRERPGSRPVVSGDGHDGDHLPLLRPIRDGHRRPGRPDPALRREVRELRGRRTGRDHRGRSGSNAGVARDRGGAALGDRRNRSRDRVDPRRALSLARGACRDLGRCRNRLRRLAPERGLVRRVVWRHHPTRRRARSRGAAARRRHGLRGVLSARDAGAARRRRRTARRRPQGDR